MPETLKIYYGLKIIISNTKTILLLIYNNFFAVNNISNKCYFVQNKKIYSKAHWTHAISGIIFATHSNHNKKYYIKTVHCNFIQLF